MVLAAAMLWGTTGTAQSLAPPQKLLASLSSLQRCDQVNVRLGHGAQGVEQRSAT